ncbi:hypothetical protein RDI58_012550 [Solanum bulbocastanum]|uniref:KIB1-4 beta-propeller domain-containing protein n=1 Tax=Solanum bulbocastanum TaxID=147425 RepID=A0AAN8TPA1_SOLBU
MVADKVKVSIPLLMLAEKEGNEEKRWLFTTDKEGNINLFHLNSRTLIELPHMNTLKGFDCDNECDYCEYYVQKALLSSDPHTTNDYILMINQGVPHSLAYWKPGKNSFITVETRKTAYADVTWDNGQFYGVDVRGNVVILNFRGGLEPTIGRIVEGVPSEFICCIHL